MYANALSRSRGYRLGRARSSLEHFARLFGNGFGHENLLRSSSEHGVGAAEAVGTLQQARNPVVAEQPLDHFGLHRGLGEGDLDQPTATRRRTLHRRSSGP